MNTAVKYKFTALGILFTIYSSQAESSTYIWGSSDGSLPQIYPTALEGCIARVSLAYKYRPYGFDIIKNSIAVDHYDYKNEPWGYITAYCRYTYYEVNKPYNSQTIINHTTVRYGSSCETGKIYNSSTGACESPSGPLDRKQIGQPDDSLSCNAPSNIQGNPINLITGNKFQHEIDYPNNHSHFSISLSRYFNSSDGVWRHSYSTKLFIGSASIVRVNSDGRESLFIRSGDTTLPETTELGMLSKNGSNWIYTAPNNDIEEFDETGRLIYWKRSGIRQTITYTGSNIKITDAYGNELLLTENLDHQLLALHTERLSISYTYNFNRQLVSTLKTTNNQTQIREYHYEVPSKPNLLTGITDERGVRYATWTYDNQDRAISSEHADGADKVTLTYNTDGSTTVTNELGKQATYRLETIQGIRRIVAIEGEPSPNCPNSNSSFTYDSRGLLKTKTDNKGILTTYDYNDRGLEVSRTEAAGTPQARTTTTTWHPTLFLPLTVTEAGRTTHYQYDDQGRQISRTIDSL